MQLRTVYISLKFQSQSGGQPLCHVMAQMVGEMVINVKEGRGSNLAIM